MQFHGVSPETFAIEDELASQLQHFQQFYGKQYASLLLERRLREEQIVSVLQLFVRRDLFGHFLMDQIRPRQLPPWLAAKRKKAAIVDFEGRY